MAIPFLTPDIIWQVYYYIAIFATALFVIKLTIFAVLGGDSEVFADFNTETDTDCSFNFISIQSVISFFMGFGWMGYAGLMQIGFRQFQNFIIAFMVGFIFMFVSAALMFLTKKLEKNVKKDKTKALNKLGRAYTSFSPHTSGQVEIEINGQLSVVAAMNDTDSHINSFDPVKVVKVANDLLYIEKYKKIRK
ncbi:hypothetical protein IJ541_08340 [bacterium]|nr:hypothetical protein [bacterium]